MTDLKNASIVQATFNRQIQRAATAFGDHEGINDARIIRWILQFSNEDFQLAIKILDNITYYSTGNIRAMIRELLDIIHQKFEDIPQERILFIPIGEPYEGSRIIARFLRDLLGRRQARRRIKHMLDLDRLTEGTYDAIVFLDDFSGTGSRLVRWWDMVEPLVRPKDVHFVVALLVLNHIARPAIEDFSEVLCIDELNEEDNVISEESRRFEDTEKTKIIHYCESTGCNPDYRLGYGNCGLLVAFKHQCPNNSLSILWHTNESWEGLFRRSA